MNKETLSNDELSQEEFNKILDINIEDPAVLEQYYSFLKEAIPKILNSLNYLANHSISKEVIKTYKMRLEALNSRYSNETDPEVLKSITEEVSKVHRLVSEEANDQRAWLKSFGMGAVGTTLVGGLIVFGVKNKELSKNIIKNSISYLKK